jgi:hypothetical protein
LRVERQRERRSERETDRRTDGQREKKREGERVREKEREREREKERMKVALLEGERESAYAYVVSRSPQTHTLVPGFARHENTCLWRERESCNRAATELQQSCNRAAEPLLQLSTLLGASYTRGLRPARHTLVV